MRRQLLIVCVLISAAELGWAQRARVSRPSDQSSSQTLGRVGGARTGLNDVSSLRGSRASGPVGMPGSGQFTQRGGRVPRAHIPSALLLGRPGFRMDRGAGHPLFRIPQYDPMELRGRSGLTNSMSLTAPGMLGWQPPPVYLPATPYVAPSVERSAFADYFDLQPEPEAETKAPVADGPGPDLSLVDLLRRENELIVEQRLARALRAFRNGTTPRAEDRLEQLAVAQDILADLVRLRPDDPVPAVLLTHTALHREHLGVAMQTLLELINRDPLVFSRDLDVAQYYGDPEMLEMEMRRRQRVGDQNAQQAMAYGLQAYCNMVLGDASRTREALAKMVAVNRQNDKDARIRVVGLAIASAIR